MGLLTCARVITVHVRCSTDGSALVFRLLVVSPLQAQRKRQSAQASRKTETLLRTAVLLRAGARRTRRTSCAVPAAATSSSAAATVVVLFDVRLLVSVLALLANAEDGEQSVEEGACAAEEAEKQKEQYAENDTNDDTGDCASAEAVVAFLSWYQATRGARGYWCLKGHCGGRRAGVGDYDDS